MTPCHYVSSSSIDLSVISASTTACLLPDLDLTSTTSEHTVENTLEYTVEYTGEYMVEHMVVYTVDYTVEYVQNTTLEFTHEGDIHMEIYSRR